MEPIVNSFYAHYYSTDDKRTMLGGVTASDSCRYSHYEDAAVRLDAIISIHATLGTPLRVEGKVLTSSLKPEIVRHCSTPQAIGCRCPECGVIV